MLEGESSTSKRNDCSINITLTTSQTKINHGRDLRQCAVIGSTIFSTSEDDYCEVSSVASLNFENG